MAEYNNRAAYLAALDERGGLPRGFQTATTPLTFRPAERPASNLLTMNLALILAEEPTHRFAAMYTRNRFPGWPVVIGRQRLAEGRLRGILVNNRISNVNTNGGDRAALAVLDRLAQELGCEPETLCPSSTGVIGWGLPVREMQAAIPALCGRITAGSARPLAEAIMTTDAFPKVRSARVGEGDDAPRIVGVAKGAGMIEPNMATMLVFLMTDAPLAREVLQRSLERSVAHSFNRISVDGDQSTSDTVILLSSARAPAVDETAFSRALDRVCGELAVDVVRNGEGTRHVLRVTVEGRLAESQCDGAARAVVNSPLVKSAVFGNDPNVGRILMALGDYLGNAGIEARPDELSFAIGGVPVYHGGRFALDQTVEDRVSRIMAEAICDPSGGFPPHERTVDIAVVIGEGMSSATVTGSDLSYDYVRENADYRS